MFRAFAKIAAFSVVALVIGAGLLVYQDRFFNSAQIAKLEEDKKQLQQIVQRLEGERRVADVLVSRREIVNDVPQTTLLFVEYDRNNQPLPAKSFCIAGTSAHIDAMVIKFDHDFVAQNDPLRGHSIALFTKIYGDKQTPADAFPIDAPGAIPDIYRGADPRLTEFDGRPRLGRTRRVGPVRGGPPVYAHARIGRGIEPRIRTPQGDLPRRPQTTRELTFRGRAQLAGFDREPTASKLPG
jgi:hypothetical protein